MIEWFLLDHNQYILVYIVTIHMRFILIYLNKQPNIIGFIIKYIIKCYLYFTYFISFVQVVHFRLCNEK